MTNEVTPYIARYPGDLIAAEDWNEMQVMIRDDISTKVGDAIDEIENVPHADDSDKLGGKTTEELTDEIVEKALAEIPSRTGYQRLFKVLKVGEENVVEHGLHEFPLVDVYQLDYFNVVCSEDDDRYESWVTFYLYHSGERKIRFKPDEDGATAKNIEIEPTDGHAYRIPFEDMLYRYDISFTDDSSLDDLETEFWQAFLAEPNDSFDDEQYCHSPWFDRCCREKMTVGNIKRRNEWDDMWFQVRPRKTINYPYTAADGAPSAPDDTPMPAPTQIQVVHYDFDTLGIKLLSNPVYPAEAVDVDEDTGQTKIKSTDRDVTEELKVMLLLKV